MDQRSPSSDASSPTDKHLVHIPSSYWPYIDRTPNTEDPATKRYIFPGNEAYSQSVSPGSHQHQPQPQPQHQPVVRSAPQQQQQAPPPILARPPAPVQRPRVIDVPIPEVDYEADEGFAEEHQPRGALTRYNEIVLDPAEAQQQPPMRRLSRMADSTPPPQRQYSDGGGSLSRRQAPQRSQEAPIQAFGAEVHAHQVQETPPQTNREPSWLQPAALLILVIQLIGGIVLTGVSGYRLEYALAANESLGFRFPLIIGAEFPLMTGIFVCVAAITGLTGFLIQLDGLKVAHQIFTALGNTLLLFSGLVVGYGILAKAFSGSPWLYVIALTVCGGALLLVNTLATLLSNWSLFRASSKTPVSFHGYLGLISCLLGIGLAGISVVALKQQLGKPFTERFSGGVNVALAFTIFSLYHIFWTVISMAAAVMGSRALNATALAIGTPLLFVYMERIFIGFPRLVFFMSVQSGNFGVFWAIASTAVVIQFVQLITMSAISHATFKN